MANEKETKTGAGTESRIAVGGMTCGNCVRHVRGALEELEGVRGVEVRLAEGEVRVVHDLERAPLSALLEAIREAGYEASI